jgi:hypothetical protein
MRWLQSFRKHRSGTLALLTLALAACGRSGDVSGKATFMGSSLAGGWVTFNYQDGEHSPVSGFIGSDGKYRIAGCPLGDARVTIHAALGRWKDADGQNPTSIPIRYTDAEQTDIVVTIERGSQELDLELEP